GTLTAIGMQRRCDLVLITGRDLAIAASYRAGNPPAGPAAVPSEFVRLRAGSHGTEVTRLASKLGISDSSDATYFGAKTRRALINAQTSRRAPLDGIYSPALDREWGWGVFAEQHVA